MIKLDDKHLLMIEPIDEPSEEPIIDEITKKITALFRSSKVSEYNYRGFHSCHCGASSSDVDYFIDNFMTNSLCIHYVAYHRKEVPQSEIDKINLFDIKGEQSTEEELNKPVHFKYDGDKRKRIKEYHEFINSGITTEEYAINKMANDMARIRDEEIINDIMNEINKKLL